MPNHASLGAGETVRSRPGADGYKSSRRPRNTWSGAGSPTRRVVVTVSRRRRSWETRSNVPPYSMQRRFQLLDSREVQVVGGLVQHQEIDAKSGERGQFGPSPLTRRKRRGRADHRIRAQAELGQLRPRLVAGESGRRHEGIGEIGAVAEDAPVLARVRPPRRWDREIACPRASGRRPSRASTSVVLPDPLGPTSATRSAQARSRVNGPRVKSPRSTTASSSRTTTSPERFVSLMLKRRSQPSHGFSTASNESSAALRRRALPARASVRSMRNFRCTLSLSRGCFFSRATPVVAHRRSRWARWRSSARRDS